MLDPDLERKLRAAINPIYEDVRGTESYERKQLLDEIDRLRGFVAHLAVPIGYKLVPVRQCDADMRQLVISDKRQNGG